MEELYDSFNFDMNFNFESSNSVQKFTNMVRNMISGELVKKPIKSGRSLILAELEFLQLIVARKYLAAGCSMKDLAGFLLEMEVEELYDRLFTKQLADITKVAGRVVKTVKVDWGHYDPSKSTLDSIAALKDASKDLFHHIKVGTGLYLHVKHGKFGQSDIEKMIADLKQYLK